MLSKNVFYLTVFLPVLMAFTVQGQIRFRPDEIITFSDFRSVYALDFNSREVFFASSNGIWRLDRYTGNPLDPWFMGHGFGKAISLQGGKALLWHDQTQTLWLMTDEALKYFRWDVNQWFEFPSLPTGQIQALGETADRVFLKIKVKNQDQSLVESEELRIFELNPFSFHFEGAAGEVLDPIRWVTFWDPSLQKYYRLNPQNWIFNRDSGLIIDQERRGFKLAYELEDSHFKKQYLCYPGLGLGIADFQSLDLEIIQPGLAGKDVQAVGMAPGGFIWIGGDNGGQAGINLYDREHGTWRQFEAKIETGLESHRIFDLAVTPKICFFASDEGLVQYNILRRNWKTLDRFEGLAGLELRALAVADGELFIGGDRGLNRMSLPSGSIREAGDRTVNRMHVADLVADGDTVWASGLEGLYQWQPDQWKNLQSDDGLIGDEAGRCLALNSDYLWIGGARGIRQYHRGTGAWQSWLNEVFTPQAQPRALAANDSLLWVGTNSGLYAKKIEQGNWIHYGLKEGLPSLRIQSLTLEADTLWIGTPEGLTRFLWNRPHRDVF